MGPKESWDAASRGDTKSASRGDACWAALGVLRDLTPMRPSPSLFQSSRQATSEAQRLLRSPWGVGTAVFSRCSHGRGGACCLVGPSPPPHCWEPTPALSSSDGPQEDWDCLFRACVSPNKMCHFHRVWKGTDFLQWFVPISSCAWVVAVELCRLPPQPRPLCALPQHQPAGLSCRCLLWMSGGPCGPAKSIWCMAISTPFEPPSCHILSFSVSNL